MALNMSPTFRRIVLKRAAKVTDLGAVTAVFFIAFAIASGSFTLLSFTELLAIRIKLSNLLYFAGYVGVCAVTFSSCGLYVSHRLSRLVRHLREIITGVTFITTVLLLVRQPLEFTFASNYFLVVFWLLSIAVLALPRVIGYQLLRRARAHGRNLRRIVIVGEGSNGRALAKRLENEVALGYKVVHIIDAMER
jgi:FlaA1/EpsC-like NDP-sugar epimerase